jgi:hypothetical protein
MSIPANPYSEANAAESQRKTFKGVGCAAGALAFPAPFIFGFPGGFGMVPVLIIVGFVFMFLAISAKGRRDRAVWAVAQAQPGEFTPPAGNIPPIFLPSVTAPAPAAGAVAPTNSAASSSSDPEIKLNQRLNKAKKAGL